MATNFSGPVEMARWGTVGRSPITASCRLRKADAIDAGGGKVRERVSSLLESGFLRFMRYLQCTAY